MTVFASRSVILEQFFSVCVFWKSKSLPIRTSVVALSSDVVITDAESEPLFKSRFDETAIVGPESAESVVDRRMPQRI